MDAAAPLAGPVSPSATAAASEPAQPVAAATASQPGEASVAMAVPGSAAAPAGPAAAADVSGTGSSTPAPAALPAHVADQIRTHLRSVRPTAQGTHEATLILDPEHLGPVRIRMQVGDGTVALQLAGATAATADVLRDALPDLRRGLEQAGLQLGSADVTDGWSGPGGQAQREAAHTRQPAAANPSILPGSSSPATATPRTAPGTRTDRLDLLA
jgi:flagellar hook-length control protein FliK